MIKACQDNSPRAQRALIKLFFGYAKTICIKYAASVEEVEEMINDGFLKVFNNLNKYDHAQPFKAWLRTIMVNTAIDYYRKWQKYNNQDSLDNIEALDVSEDVIGKIAAEEILKLVQQLPPSYRMVFTLYVVEGYNHREIAELLGIREGTSKSNLQDARKKLQALIKNNYPHLYIVYGQKNLKIHEN
ncbi:MAG: sigma-70 family RNA polymerase sigma factor [Bacteroidota bacterium]|nr:sigma-70 family RNA polymerase sigma factor [Bacteroidota bacterium]